MAELPTGTVTFLFTDIAGSTRLWERHPHAMPAALARHDAILRDAIEGHGGAIFHTAGDAFGAAFANAPAALTCALAAQRALQAEPWGESDPLRVRMALHTGTAEARDGDYFGPPLNRAARLLAAGHAGQVLLSAATQELARDLLPPAAELRDMGVHRLKDLIRPEQIFQLVAPDLPATFPPLNTLERRPHNLPAQPTALIGREREVAAICALLQRPDVRLVTLTGPGGTGKTRLALQCAAELLSEFSDGAWFVNLAPLGDASLVAATVAQTLGVREGGGRPLPDLLKEYLLEKQQLLLVDNFEQVADAAPLVGDLLAAAPGLKVLVTSRMPLHLSGEREYAVAPLGLPPQPKAKKPTELAEDRGAAPIKSSATSVAELTHYEAVRLFIERAQAVKADFTVTNANAPAVAEICYRLDGLPLALELAAARVKLFPPQALLARLGSRLKLLTGGARDLPARQQTIRNTIDWSYQLLGTAEQQLFTRLGVFMGGWTLEAAAAMCNTERKLPIDVVDGIAALLDQSLVQQEEGLDDEPRFTMLETIREYALEQLAACGEADTMRQQHAEYFLALAEEAQPLIWFMRPERDPWMARLDAEQDNLRTALEWFGIREEIEFSLRLAWALHKFWELRFHWNEGRGWLEAALAKSGSVPTAARAKALVAAGQLAYSLGHSTARVYVEEGLALLRTLGDKAAIANALWMVCRIVSDNGEYALARAYAEECLGLFDELGNPWGRPYPLLLLGNIATVQGDLDQAAVYYQENLTFYRQIGYPKGIGLTLTSRGVIAQLQDDWDQAVALFAEGLAILRELGDKENSAVAQHNLGGALLHQGHTSQAAACFAEGLALSQEIGHRAGVAINLAGTAGVAAVRGQPERSARLFGAAQALFDAMGMVVEPVDRAEYDRYIAVARAHLGEQAFAAAQVAGRTLPLEQAIALALAVAAEVPPPAPPPPPAPQFSAAAAYPAGLTVREVEVLRLVAQGLTDAQVAKQLILSTHTVHAHLRAIYGKLDVTSRAAATRFAVDNHLV